MCYSSCNYCDIRHKLVLTGKSYLNTIKTIFLTAPPYRALLYLLPYCGARFFIATANDILRSCHICGYKRLLCIVSARPVAAPLLWQRHNVYRPLAGLPAAHREKPFLAQGADNTFVYLVRSGRLFYKKGMLWSDKAPRLRHYSSHELHSRQNNHT